MVDLDDVGISQEALVLVLNVVLDPGGKLNLVEALGPRLSEHARAEASVSRSLPVVSISKEDELVQIQSIDILVGAVLPHSVLSGLMSWTSRV